MLRMRAGGEFREIGDALILENVDQADAGGVKSPDGHFLDELVRVKARVGEGTIELGSGCGSDEGEWILG